MSLTVKKSRESISPENFKMKALVFSLPGSGKTTWMSTANQLGLGVAACETGQGNGLLSVAQENLDYVEPQNLAELEAFCNGAVFKDKAVVCLDSLSYMVKSFIKDAALAIPRAGGNSPKRSQGVPELDDYGVMAEISRRLLAKLLARDQHLIVTALEKEGPSDNDGVSLFVPDLPGALALTCTAMFDFVFRLRTRQRFTNQRDPSTRYTERYLITQPDGLSTLAKCRSNDRGVPLLPKEVVFNLETGEGSFPWMLKKITEGYKGQPA